MRVIVFCAAVGWLACLCACLPAQPTVCTLVPACLPACELDRLLVLLLVSVFFLCLLDGLRAACPIYRIRCWLRKEYFFVSEKLSMSRRVFLTPCSRNTRTYTVQRSSRRIRAVRPRVLDAEDRGRSERKRLVFSVVPSEYKLDRLAVGRARSIQKLQ